MQRVCKRTRGHACALEANTLRELCSPQAPFLKPNDDGLEGDRRFFASWDQVWRTKYTDSAVQLQVQTNPHSPGQARAIIPVQNSDPWYTAYGISKGKDLYLDLEHRVQIW